MINRNRMTALLVLMLLVCMPMRAQKFSLGTNFIEWANLATLNLETSFALGRHWSLCADIKYNPFEYSRGENEFRSKQRSLSLGGRWWGWHVWSGWWTAAALRYQEYNVGGFSSAQTEEGDRLGASLSAGYTYMLSPHLNLDFSLGLFTGQKWYTAYSCPTCGDVVGAGKSFFILPDKIAIALSYVF